MNGQNKKIIVPDERIEDVNMEDSSKSGSLYIFRVNSRDTIFVQEGYAHNRDKKEE